ncbi:MAG: fluoride efflux transporter FluC [Arthrobacter sp.]|uniref:fluoride efflux transporter FluC n=1 Tax=unclassified Arthrobacter TaxID=235627 RepID=UPI00264C410A|nr:CrcB family protein [Micrococcaceae bacterium]MDN5813030.1 CrcB family protein [Micrococcaceae bacterium]MDN5823481.1 CrcB family protein [Micrococcaceae bacterium]MDN5879271.1 CrcB family protein [Micrococcaceae bacterium]MDN5887294.1 CrcB family protein [Micrococcaceae bacterium]
MSRASAPDWRHLGLVVVGGMVGTAAREGLTLAVPGINGLPTTILMINIIGAFLLGLLLESLLRAGSDEGPRRIMRLMLGTGFCGGFTTYSAFAVDALLLFNGQGPVGGPGAGLALIAATVLIGAAATWAGIATAGLRRPRREARP